MTARAPAGATRDAAARPGAGPEPEAGAVPKPEPQAAPEPGAGPEPGVEPGPEERRPTLREAAGSTAFFAGLVISTVVFALLAPLTAPLPYRARYRFITRWSRLNLWWLGVSCGLRFIVEGARHLPREPSVVLCRHESMWETLALQTLFAPQTWLLKKSLLRVPFFGWGLALLRPIAIDRGSGREAIRMLVREGARALDDGAWVVVFPEGTRLAPGERRGFHRGGAFLAARTGRAIVPVAHNSGDFWRRRRFIKRTGTIRLVIGPPIPPGGASPTELNRRAEEWVHTQVAAIRGRAAGRQEGSRAARAAGAGAASRRRTGRTCP